MDEKAIERIMVYYGKERQDRCHYAITAIDCIIKELTKLKDKIDFNKCAEPTEKVYLKLSMIPDGTINNLRKHLAEIDKCSEVLETLDDLLPEPDAE